MFVSYLIAFNLKISFLYAHALYVVLSCAPLLQPPKSQELEMSGKYSLTSRQVNGRPRGWEQGDVAWVLLRHERHTPRLSCFSMV
jgi:hypothetical protein